MPVYCVCGELTDPPIVSTPWGPETLSRASLPTVADELAALGPSVQLSRTTWLIETTRSAAELMERLSPHVLAADDRVVVFRVGSPGDWGCHNGTGDPAVCEWMAGRLGA